MAIELMIECERNLGMGIVNIYNLFNKYTNASQKVLMTRKITNHNIYHKLELVQHSLYLKRNVYLNNLHNKFLHNFDNGAKIDHVNNKF